MPEKSKIDRKLKNLVEMAGDASPSFEVDLIVTTNREEAVEPLVEGIVKAGGRILRQTNDRLRCTIPLAKVPALGERKEITSIRLTRMHRMHAR